MNHTEYVDPTDGMKWARNIAAMSAATALAHAFRAVDAGPSGYPTAPITMALIYLNDGMQLSNILGQRIADTGPDIQKTGKEQDLTSLIATGRNAACHMGSKTHIVDRYQNGNSFSLLGPKMSMQFDDMVLDNQHTDDFALYFGVTRIYLIRNMKLALSRLAEVTSDNVGYVWQSTLKGE